MPRSSRTAALSFRMGILAVLLCAIGVIAARFGWVPTYVGFQVFALGLVPGTLITLALGATGLVKTRPSTGRGGRGSALAGLALGLALLAGLVALAAPHAGAPPIHDVTTDPDDPPAFREIAKLPDNQGRDLTYPHGGARVTEQQRDAYPDLGPVRLPVSPDEAFDAVQDAIAEMSWTVVWSNRVLGVIEAYDTSSAFRFVDDVAIRIREDGGGSVIDVRSTSRVGVSDLGANARRIRELTARLAR